MIPASSNPLSLALVLLLPAAPLSARQWVFKALPDPVEAEFVTQKNGYVLLRGSNGKSFEVPATNFSQADQQFIKLLSSDPEGRMPLTDPGQAITKSRDYRIEEFESITGTLISPPAATEIHLTGNDDPLLGSSVNFTAADGWLFFDRIKPTVVASRFLNRMLVNTLPAELGKNVRIAAYGHGAVVIPHSPEWPALTIHSSTDCGGSSLPLQCYTKYGANDLAKLNGPIRSFILKRGYMATLAENEDGTGVSRNFVAQDHDIVVSNMPKGLDQGVQFVRVFPWRWSPKKGIAGGIHKNLNVGWFYDWNIGARSSPDLEYVAIKQKRYWPGMNQDWKAKGINHLLGFNEPDRPDQANMTVEEAIKGWPELQRTGLRLGSPATSDGGLGWLYDFMKEADRRSLRVDFVAVHYYRAHSNPSDAKGAAQQMRRFLEEIHERTKRPLWVTEWNNGANWTSAPDPNERQQRKAIEAMISMMDEAPFVERYAPFNWVEPVRELVRKDGSLTPAGQAYHDQISPISYEQPRSSR